MLHHVTGQHEWKKRVGYGRCVMTLNRIDKCLHAPMTKDKQNEVAWLTRGSPAYLYLQEMVFDKRMIKSLRRCCDFLHTSEVESFHSALLRFLPKPKKLDKEAFDARTQMAIMHFNENIGRPSRLTKTGATKTRLALPPSTGV